MTLPQPIAVAAAVADGAYTDVREWIRVDIVGSPSVHRRGYVVIVEPTELDGRSRELASQVRDLMLHQLRLYAQYPPEGALMQALGHANDIVRVDNNLGGNNRVLIGVTAVVLDDHTATIAHLPPSQVVLVQDHLVYSVPDLDSHLPRWAEYADPAPTPEPLGFGNVVAPILVQTELMPGDTMVLANHATGGVLARNEQGDWLIRGQDPESILEAIRDDVAEAKQPFSTVVVISFPPNERTSEIVTISDVARNAREQIRHARAAVSAIMPSAPAMPSLHRSATPESEDTDADDIPARPRISLQERLIRITEGRPAAGEGTWQPRRAEAAFGAPGAHGVRRHRRISQGGGPFSWKSGVPRAPFITSPIFVGIALVAVFLVGMLIWNQRDIFEPDESAYIPFLAQVDQRLNAIDGMEEDEDIIAELDAAQTSLDTAKTNGAPGDLVEPRQLAITTARDETNNVIRVTAVDRIGSLPGELQNGESSALMTSGGIFLVNGDLYRLNPETAQMQKMLEQGREIEGVRVGPLFGVAYDGQFLVVTDGRALFFASNTDGAIWQAMEMEEINNQGPWPPGPMSAFNNNMYLLVAEYRNIYAFNLDANRQAVAPIDWISTGDRVNINIAVDLTIDGNIYVLLSDGQVVVLRSGLEVNRWDLPNFEYPEEKPIAIVSGPATGYLYVAVVDGDGNGRIIATDYEGENAVELQLPIGFSPGGVGVADPFDGLQDMVVDEQRGKLYLINEDAVWSVDYGLPPLPGAPAATPDAAE